MSTYHIESVINEHGVIILPDEMKYLQKHRVKITIVDLEAKYNDPLDFLNNITHKYSNIDEKDLNLSEIYKQRDKIDERQVMFD